MPDSGDDLVVEPLVAGASLGAGEDPDRRSSGRLRSPRGGRHDLAEPAGDDDAPALGEQPAHLLGLLLVLGAASDDGHLDRDRAMVSACRLGRRAAEP